jgi:hypothetical protein
VQVARRTANELLFSRLFIDRCFGICFPANKDRQRKWHNAFRRVMMILTVFAVGLAEPSYLPRYGIEWLLLGLAASAVLASFWIRAYWD